MCQAINVTTGANIKLFQNWHVNCEKNFKLSIALKNSSLRVKTGKSYPCCSYDS